MVTGRKLTLMTSGQSSVPQHPLERNVFKRPSQPVTFSGKASSFGSAAALFLFFFSTKMSILTYIVKSMIA